VIAIGLSPTVGEFVYSPKNQTVDEGERTSFYCTTEEGPIPWKENDVLLDKRDRRVSGVKILGLYYSTLTIVGTSENNGTRVQCVSSDGEESGVATLFVRGDSGEESTGNYSVENKNPVTTTVSDKNPVTTTVSDKNPVTTTVSDKNPVTTTVSDKNPVTTTVSDKNPVTTPVSAPDETNDSDVPGQDEKEPPQGKDAVSGDHVSRD
jgi:hypothetical protein